MTKQLATETEGEDELLVNGIDWTTGQLLPPVTPAAITEDHPAVRKRAERGSRHGIVDDEVADGNCLEESGWGVIFGASVTAEVKARLAPLLQQRKKQAGPLYKEFEGVRGSTAADALSWLTRHEVGLSAVNPRAGVPYYLLIVASPQDISFEFQYMLDTYWAVGRLHFDFPDGYRRYAEQVVDYETASVVRTSRTAGIFAPQIPGDRATAFFANQMAWPLAKGVPPRAEGELPLYRPLGEVSHFKMRVKIGAEASKDNLRSMLMDSDRVAFLLTGSHGSFLRADVPNQLDRIGSLVTQEWQGSGSPLTESCTFSALDLEHDKPDLSGLIHFSFACYSAGCPALDTYTREPDGTKRHLLDNDIVARLPQRSLELGALAVLGHVDRAFSYSFQNAREKPQIQDMRGVMLKILRGDRIGLATDVFNMRWSVLSGLLSDAQRDRDSSGIDEARLTSLWVQRDEARNYVVLGDPAVRLRVDDLK